MTVFPSILVPGFAVQLGNFSRSCGLLHWSTSQAASAEQAIDRAIAAGNVSRELPFARRELVAALTAIYSDDGAAAAGIELLSFGPAAAAPRTEQVYTRPADATRRRSHGPC